MAITKQSFLEKCYKDEKGKIALFQSPNLPIVVWLLSTLVSRFVSHGTFHGLFATIAFGALFTWAWLELFSGVNYLRRALGLTVIILLIHNRL